MGDYESQYEEYKQSILQNRQLRNELHEKYLGSLRVEKDYVDENGILWKVGVLGVVCGFLLSFIRIDNWVLGVIAFIGLLGVPALAQYIGAKFKKNLGETIFYAFWYHKHFEEHIQENKRKEMYQFEESLTKIADYMQWQVDRKSNDPSEVFEQFRHASHRIGELEKQYKHISRYDSFAGSLKNDYNFNAEIQQHIDKYI